MSEQLWTDQRIAAEVYDCALGYQAHHALKRMRNEYEARITELQSLVDAYAQRVTVQDTEIAILRQREEVR